jgi:hypothetical protein
MADFSQFLRRTSGEAKKPPILPAGDYPGLIKSFKVDDDNKNRTVFVRFQLAYTDWPAGAPDSWEQFNKELGKSEMISRSDVDLAKRQPRKDYYMTDDALWRLDEALKSIGLELGPPYEELFPQAVGLPVLISVSQGLNTATDEVFNQVDKISGLK